MKEFASADFTAGQLNALVKIVGPQHIKDILSGELEFQLNQARTFRQLAEIPVKSMERFVANEVLSDFNIDYVDDRLKPVFELKEFNLRETSIAMLRLEKFCPMIPILAQLSSRAKIHLGHFFQILKHQAKGGQGPLSLVEPNYVCIDGQQFGSLRILNFHWNASDFPATWNIHEHSVVYKEPVKHGALFFVATS
ncbi:MAG: hypothetical protein EXS59_02820 [Candidatus Taylorbacteria bacterium]|nr:hypothetical protein [Candidatus Taylorbacteria bacterium]